ncbi:MAG: PsiF family protein [Sideroxydans sp.]|nr:PsiF family protein [Sideroxydans sp.]
MKRIIFAVQCLLLSFSVSAAQVGQDCEAKSQQVKPEARQAFLTSCLAQVSSPANVQAVTQKNKQESCAQNEKNMKKAGVNKPGYMNECMTKNEAAAEAQKVANASPAAAPAPVVHHAKPVAKVVATSAPVATAKPNSKKSCAKQAHKKHLKGEERKQFMTSCAQG